MFLTLLLGKDSDSVVFRSAHDPARAPGNEINSLRTKTTVITKLPRRNDGDRRIPVTGRNTANGPRPLPSGIVRSNASGIGDFLSRLQRWTSYKPAQSLLAGDFA